MALPAEMGFEGGRAQDLFLGLFAHENDFRSWVFLFQRSHKETHFFGIEAHKFGENAVYGLRVFT